MKNKKIFEQKIDFYIIKLAKVECKIKTLQSIIETDFLKSINNNQTISHQSKCKYQKLLKFFEKRENFINTLSNIVTFCEINKI